MIFRPSSIELFTYGAAHKLCSMPNVLMAPSTTVATEQDWLPKSMPITDIATFYNNEPVSLQIYVFGIVYIKNWLLSRFQVKSVSHAPREASYCYCSECTEHQWTWNGSLPAHRLTHTRMMYECVCVCTLHTLMNNTVVRLQNIREVFKTTDQMAAFWRVKIACGCYANIAE